MGFGSILLTKGNHAVRRCALQECLCVHCVVSLSVNVEWVMCHIFLLKDPNIDPFPIVILLYSGPHFIHAQQEEEDRMSLSTIDVKSEGASSPAPPSVSTTTDRSLYRSGVQCYIGSPDTLSMDRSPDVSHTYASHLSSSFVTNKGSLYQTLLAKEKQIWTLQKQASATELVSASPESIAAATTTIREQIAFIESEKMGTVIMYLYRAYRFQEIYFIITWHEIIYSILLYIYIYILCNVISICWVHRFRRYTVCSLVSRVYVSISIVFIMN